jgi:hypothetical protein
MGPPIKRLVVRIGDEVRRAVGWRRFVPLAALAGCLWRIITEAEFYALQEQEYCVPSELQVAAKGSDQSIPPCF